MQPAHTQPRDGPLEDHLRSLILTSSDPAAVSILASQSDLPSDDLQTGHELHGGQTHTDALRVTPRGGRKRPNQAQRRQMNAELTIPIDTRGPVHLSSQQHARPHHYRDSQPFQRVQHVQNVQQPQQVQHPSSFSAQSSAYPVQKQDWATSNEKRSHGQSRPDHAPFSTFPSHHQPDWRHQPHPHFDGLSRGVNVIPADSFSSHGGRHPTQPQSALYNPGGHRHTGLNPEHLINQSAFLDRLCHQVIAGAQIGPDEIAEKESFRRHVEAICRHVVSRHEHETNGAREFRPETVELKCFGSLASGFATKAADMDLGLLSPMSQLSPNSPESPIPRLIEEALLAAGFGARLLTKTRIPIIKLCEKPDITLRKNLLEARMKWENGTEEERELDDDAPEDPDPLPDSDSPIDANPKQAPTNSQTPQAPLSIQEASPHEEDISSFRQSSRQSLASYYSSAKRLLRRLNGRDITHSNSQEFTEANYILLDKVAKVFIEGLYDSDLRRRILAYPSFHIGEISRLVNYRSLFGVNLMIEGEKLIISWESRQLSSLSSKSDQSFERVIRRWTDLQYSKNFGITPYWFNKELQLAVEALRQIPSIQIMHLQQEQYESPTHYHGRANTIAIAMSGTHSLSGVGICSSTIQHYVNGIRDKKIRYQVHDFVALTGTQVLRTVARKHKALHLAADYERAIQHDCYRPEDLPVLQSYIDILCRKPIRSVQQPTDFEYLIPVMQNEVGMLDSIRQLPDPATLSPNKPRDKYNDILEFPKKGVGVQCDVNFSAHLALQNTLLLRCYSYVDPRVRPVVLFVKHWAKARGINSPYRGTLSSYGYVLMVLHYLVNVVEPFVCPNLQELAPPDPDLPPQALEGITTCQGRNVRFWRDEQAIQTLAQQGQLNQNHNSLGTLLRGFFEYYAQGGMMDTLRKKGFNWGRDVISLRTHGGLQFKTDKGWTGAKTVIQPHGGTSPASAELNATRTQSPLQNNNTAPQPNVGQPLSPDGAAPSTTEQLTPKSKDVKEVRHRFLFAIEDPFELDHNVARTVTHNGIVAIRDEFRRAWRIIKAAGKGPVDEDLLEDVEAHDEGLKKKQFMSLLDEIHGNETFPDPKVLL
ncbi:hypothetical protein F5B17DRAFT_263974 [Nemania serpens]|nr:hypothetical protein F5B17DRAFT_263974 [Nemania serpens]